MRSSHAAACLAVVALLLTAPGALTGCASGKSGRPIRKAQGTVLARVNGQPIDQVSTERLIRMIQMQGYTPPPTTEGATPEEKVRHFAIDRLIDREVVLGLAYKEGIKADTAQVTAAYTRMKSQPGMDSTLTKNLSVDEIRLNLSEDLMVNQYLQRIQKEVADSVRVTDADMQAYYDANPDQFMAPERAHARHILVLVSESATPDQKATARKKAEEILAQVKQPGADFAAIAKEKSEDTGSAPNGGDLGPVMRNQMVKPFEDAVFALEAGQISGVVETQFGYHVIKVDERMPAGKMPLESVRVQLNDMLRQQKVQQVVQERLMALRKGVKIEYLKV